jgi:hypothetical protein
VAGTWRVRPYPENDDPRQAEPPRSSQLGLRSDGTVAGGGRWWIDGDVVRVEGASVPGGGLSLLMDVRGRLAFGRDAQTAAVRLERSGPAPGPEPIVEPLDPVAPGDPASPASPAQPVPAVPSYAG